MDFIYWYLIIVVWLVRIAFVIACGVFGVGIIEIIRMFYGN